MVKLFVSCGGCDRGEAEGLQAHMDARLFHRVDQLLFSLLVGTQLT